MGKQIVAGNLNLRACVAKNHNGWFVTCPVCKSLMKKSRRGISSHLRKHEKEGVIPKGVIQGIAIVVTNRRGLNDYLSKVDHEIAYYIRGFANTIMKLESDLGDSIRNQALRCNPVRAGLLR